MLYLTNIDLNQNQLMNAVIQPLAAAPPSPKLGQIYCDSVNNKIMWYNGSSWKTIGVIVEDTTGGDGVITVDGVEMTVYTLPIASADTLGGIKIGSGLSINASGTVSVPSLSDKVDKVSGKGLSTNDYTTDEKNKLAGIAAGAEVNVQADWNQSNTAEDDYIKNKPTKLSEFTNDQSFIDSTVSNLTNYYLKTETYSKSEVDTAVSGAESKLSDYYKKTETYSKSEIDETIAGLALIDIVVPAGGTLPATGEKNKIYLTPKSTAQTSNAYDEYIWTGSAFEKVGDTEIDLSTYLTKTGDAKDTTVTFSTATSRVSPASGETLATILGKISKHLADLKTVAFSGSYEDLSNKPTLLKSLSSEIATTETTKSISYTGTFVNATVIDSVTHDIILCDIDVTNSAVTASLASSPTNKLIFSIFYL